MTSPAGPHFRFRWTASGSRAGVFVNGSPGDVDSVRSSCTSRDTDGSLEDSFSDQFAPLPMSRSSSTSVGRSQSGSRVPDSTPPCGEAAAGLPAAGKPWDLIDRLQQLKQLQQHMQQQLKARRREQPQTLQNEHPRPSGTTQTAAASDNPDRPSLESTGRPGPNSSRPTVPPDRRGLREPEEAEGTREPGTRNREPSADLASSGRLGDRSVRGEGSTDGNACRKQEDHDPPIGSGGGGRTFEEMLEEQLGLENEKLSEMTSAPTKAAKAKRPFLRRGEGLSRFARGKSAGPVGNKATGPDDKPSPGVDASAFPGPAVGSRRSAEPKRTSPGSPSSTNVATRRKTAVLTKTSVPPEALAPTTEASAKADGRGGRRNVRAKRRDEPAGPDPLRSAKDEPEGEEVLSYVDGVPRRACGTDERSARTAENSFEAWLKERGERWERDRHREDAELGEFELLETAADEFSFSGTSSFFNALLRRDGRRFSSTPVKSPPESAFPRRYPDRGRVAGPPVPPGDGGAATEGANARPTAERFFAREAAEESDSSTCGDGVFPNPREPFGFRVSAPPYDKRSYRDDERAGSPEGQADSTLVPRVEFDDDDTWNEPESLASSPAKTDDRPGRFANGKNAVPEVAEPDGPSDDDTGPPPTCQLVAKLFPAPKPKPRPPPAEAAESESPGDPGPAKSALLRERLVELETEIERFRKENAALRRLRQENQEVQENLRRERTEFRRNMADERAEWEEFKSEETRKFQRERKSFEKHAAAARARPDKRERDEIQTLKQQLDALQEDLRKREARWSGTHGRLRQRIDGLNAENAALRDQVRTLEKLRLGTWKNEQEKQRGRSGASGDGTDVRTRTSEGLYEKQNSPPENSLKTVGQNPLQNPAKSPGATCSTDWEKEPPCPEASSRHVSEAVSEENGHRHRRLLKSSAHSAVVSEADIPDDIPDDITATSELEQEEIVHMEGKIEKACPDGGRITVFPNGTRKRVSADGLSVTVTFFNGDVKRMMPDERVIYYYAEAQTTHTTYPDGLEVLQFPNNQIEKHYTDGRKEIVFPDQTVKNLYPDGREESVLLDGTVIRQNPDGTKQIRFSTGQRELHTAEFKRREYPDGTVKTVYSDGRQETRYPNGRVRLKNPEGRVVMDTQAS